jgi:predicted nucleic acid-binding Zn ribbon protein
VTDGSDARDPIPLADALAAVRAELGLPDGDAFQVLVDGWSDVVGPDVAAHAHLDSLHDGTVSVVVDSTLWASQLRYLETMIRDRANDLVGRVVVHAVRVRVGRA